MKKGISIRLKITLKIIKFKQCLKDQSYLDIMILLVIKYYWQNILKKRETFKQEIDLHFLCVFFSLRSGRVPFRRLLCSDITVNLQH